MKQFLFILIVVGTLFACNNNTSTSDTKQTTDSLNTKKDTVKTDTLTKVDSTKNIKK